MDEREQLDLLFGVDVRGLAACRMLVALAVYRIIAAWGFASGDQRAWLQDHGHVPAADVSLVALLPGIVLAPVLLVGFHARVVAALMWAWLAWLIRAYGTVDIGVYVTVLLLMWLALLPSDAVFAVRKAPGVSSRSIRSVATGAILLQAAFLYFSAGATKNTTEWIWEGTALWDMFHASQARPAIAEIALQFPGVLALMSRATIVLEVVFPVLLFVPRRWLPQLRLAVVPWFMLLHIGLMVMFELWMISFVSLAFWFLFVPSFAWDTFWKTDKAHGVQVYGGRATTWISGSALAVAALSAALSLPMGYGVLPDPLLKLQNAVPKVGLYQSWFMFNSPASIRRAQPAAWAEASHAELQQP
jgi:hypothetical protein